MLKFLNVKFLIILCGLFCISSVFAANAVDATNYLDKAEIVSEQTELLKNRLEEARTQLLHLQAQQKNLSNVPSGQLNKELRNKARLDISVAQSNLDGINIELDESQQTVDRLEKELQEISNQLNVFSTFGTNMQRDGAANATGLRMAFVSHQNLLALEKTRVNYLLKLQAIAMSALQIYKSRYTYTDHLLKSHNLLQLRDEQTQSEIVFQQKQANLLQHLSVLNKNLESVGNDKVLAYQLQNDIFYDNESLNLIYLQMLIVRYHDQLEQLKISIFNSTSINLLNNAGEQIQLLEKQIARLRDLLKVRIHILSEHKDLLKVDHQEDTKIYLDSLDKLSNEYLQALKNLNQLDQKLSQFHKSLDQALQVELSARQGLPGFSGKAWIDLTEEALMIPSLTYQVGKSLVLNFLDSYNQISMALGFLLLVGEIIWIMAFVGLNRLLNYFIKHLAVYEVGHLNPKRLIVQLIERNIIDIAIIGNLYILFSLFGVPSQNSEFVLNIAFVWLFFKTLLILARLCLVETVHHASGHDVRLYYRLKWILIGGGVITALTVFMNQLPVIYVVKDLFNRLFLFFLLIVSVLLLKSWEVVPDLIIPLIDDKRLYFKKVIRILCLLIPLILFVNSIIGLFGYVNLVLTMYWYESIFLLVLVAYLLLRGLLVDAMIYFSNLLIRHVVNGWLWTEAFLKPLDILLRFILLGMSFVVLFLSYGWDERSPVVERFNKLLNYNLLDVLNTTITPLSIIEVTIILSFIYWATRWTREFVYRFLLSKTTDLGVRNSIAIFSQYMMVVIGVLICLRVLGIDFRALTVVAGAFAFGVGLGLRDLANNFACGFLLLIERPIRVGDTISIGGYEGDVVNIGGRAVTIKNWDNHEVLVPNAEIFSKTFENWTGKDHIVRTLLTIKISRHDNPLFVQGLIHKALADNKDVLSDPASDVLLKEISESLIEFEVRYYINLKQTKSRVGMRSKVLMSIWEIFEKNHIKPPYPHQEVHVSQEKTPRVSRARKAPVMTKEDDSKKLD